MSINVLLQIPFQGRGVRLGKGGKGIKRYKLLGIKYVRYKDAMYNTGNIANIL